MAKRGRPRIADQTSRIDLRLPLPVYDALCRVAARRGDDVRVLARRILTVGVSAVEKKHMPTSA